MSRKQKRQHPHNARPVIDIVITTGGRFDMLSKCLDALYDDPTPKSIALIDNATNSEERIANESLFFQTDILKTKRLTQEVGFPVANNEGARMGSAPLIMFLNDDVELQEGAIQKVVDDFQDETIGIVGIRLLFPIDSTSPIRPAGTIQHVGMALNIRGEAIHPLVGWHITHPKTKISRDAIAVTGACLTIRRSLFNKIGGFSLEYGLGTWEDVDLCFKARQAGMRTWVNCDAWGYHYVGATQEKKQRGYPLQQNRLIFQAKWQSSGILAWTEQDFY